jgi:hypothetical protein
LLTTTKALESLCGPHPLSRFSSKSPNVKKRWTHCSSKPKKRLPQITQSCRPSPDALYQITVHGDVIAVITSTRMSRMERHAASARSGALGSRERPGAAQLRYPSTSERIFAEARMTAQFVHYADLPHSYAMLMPFFAGMVRPRADRVCPLTDSFFAA